MDGLLVTKDCLIIHFQLHIDSHQDPSSPEFKEEVDFFAEHADTETAPEPEVAPSIPVTDNQKLYSEPVPISNGSAGKQAAGEGQNGEGPSVEHALSMSPTEAIAKAEPRKALIGAKKTGAKKGVSHLQQQVAENDLHLSIITYYCLKGTLSI